MFRKRVCYAAPLLLAGAVLFATPGSGWAVHPAGAHVAAAHFGGVHGGGVHFGGANFGSFHSGLIGGGLGLNPGLGLYSYYPSSLWLDSAYYPAYSAYGGYTAAQVPYYLDNGGSAARSTSYQSFYPPATPPENSARITATVPAGARIWFESAATTSTGPARDFYSPSLTPGKTYSYQVRATWTENGHEVTQTQRVRVTANGRVEVAFPVSGTMAARPPAAKTP